jgi:dTDP-4-amino-4,6-dideoxy-D-galactose acyltransferase
METASLPYQVLEWDSQFFGYRIGRVQGARLRPDTLSAAYQWATEQDVACMYFLAEADDALTVRTAEAGGFALQDVRVTFNLLLDHIPAHQPDAQIRHARPEDVEPLRHTARHAYVHSRFYNDSHFSQEQCAALYDLWLTRSITDPTYADLTWVGEVDGQAVGYVTCHLHQDTKVGTIGLVGVAEEARGQALGQRLIAAVLAWFAQQGMTQVQVVTQGRNIAAQRLYQRCGFLTHSIGLWYHWWRADMPLVR